MHVAKGENRRKREAVEGLVADVAREDGSSLSERPCWMRTKQEEQRDRPHLRQGFIESADEIHGQMVSR